MNNKTIFIIIAIIAIAELIILFGPNITNNKQNSNQEVKQETVANVNPEENQSIEGQNSEEMSGKRIVDYIETDNDTNKKLKFFYYIPKQLIGSTQSLPVIIWVPGLDGDGQESIPEEFYKLAENSGYAILSPSFRFNQEDHNKMKSYQFPAAWSGNALIKMLYKAKEDNGLNPSKLYMVGFSAGAQFVSRFSLLKPNVVAACAILSSGGSVLPTENTKNIKYFYGIGLKDDQFRIDNAENFVKEAQKLGIFVEYKKYNFDHTTNNQEMNDITAFFENVKSGSL